MIEARKLPKSSSISFIKEISLNVIASGHLPKQLVAPSAEEVVEKLLIEDELKKAFCVLTDRERWVLVHRFGLNGHDKLTLEETARLAWVQLSLNVTRERIRQIETKALKKLRHPRIVNYLRVLYET